MKLLTLIFLSALTLYLAGCVKTVDVVHDIHDTTFVDRYHLQIDTFTRTNVVVDTLIIKDTHQDTVTQIKHDTLIIVKTTTDTLFKSFIDTVYLTRAIHDTSIQVVTIVKHDTLQGNTVVVIRHDTLINTVVVQRHDTVNRTVYLHDTLNNFLKVYIHDTVVKINTVTVIDTVVQFKSNLYYPVPATDSQRIYISSNDPTDTSKFILRGITFDNVYSYVGDQLRGNGYYTQSVTVLPVYTQATGAYIVVPGPMVCNVTFTYDWLAPAPPTFSLQTFFSGSGFALTWKIAGPYDGNSNGWQRGQTSRIGFINLPQIFSITINPGQ